MMGLESESYEPDRYETPLADLYAVTTLCEAFPELHRLIVACIPSGFGEYEL